MTDEITIEEPTYTRSDGSVVPVAGMVTNHLRSAHAKLAREWPSHPELPGMAAELAKRDAEYQAAQADQQEQAQ